MKLSTIIDDLASYGLIDRGDRDLGVIRKIMGM
jgi:hypothetical protein